MSQVLDRVVAEADRAREDAIGLLRALIAVQRDGEDAVQAIVAARLAALGAAVERIVYAPADVPLVGEFAASRVVAAGERACVLGRLEGRGSDRSLLLFAHPDSEPVRAIETWRRDPFAGVVEDGRLYGWGVADDLLGVAAGIAALEALTAAGVVPGGTVTMASTPSKRHARGVAACMSLGLEADAAVYLHPAESGRGLGEIKAFASGQLEFRVSIAGQGPDTSEPGHTAFAHRAVNPIDKAVLVYAALTALDHDRSLRVHHPLLDGAVGRSTNLMISAFASGEDTRFSRLPLSCTLGGAISFPPHERIEDVQREVEAAVAEAAHADPWLRDHPPAVEWISGVTGAEVSPDHPLYRTVSMAVTASTGLTPSVNAMHTSSDIRNPMVQRNIPTVGLGPLAGGLTQVGSTDEWVDVGDYLRMIRVVATIIVDWTGADLRDRPSLSPPTRRTAP